MKKILLALAVFCLPFSASAALELQSSGKGKNFLYEHDSKAMASSLQLVVRSGSLSDPEGKEGLAAIAFKSLLRGTKDRPRKDFFAAVERLGASMSVDTASNRSIASLDVISDNLEESIALLAEAVMEARLEESEVRALIEEELAQMHQELSNNRSLLRRAFRKALFRGTGLEVPPNGTLESLKAITAEDVKAFLKAQVKSGNVVVAVNSNHPEKAVKSWMEKAFAEFPEGDAPAQPAPKLSAPKGRTLYVVERKGSSTTEVAVGHLGIDAGYREREVLETALFIFGGDMSSRLFQTLRGKNGWTYGAYSSYQMLEIPRRHGGSFMIYTFPQAEHTEKAALKTIELYEDFVKKGVTSQELSFAKKSLVNSYPFKFATSRSRLTARLYEYLDGATVLEVPEYRKLVNGISRSSLKKAVQKVHDPKNLLIVLVGDPEKMEPLKKAIPGVKEVKVIQDPKELF